jgi:hypothetical protein
MLPVSIFLCHMSNVTRVYLSLFSAKCYPCLFFSVLCPMLPVSIFLCLVPNVTHVYLSVSSLDTRHRKMDTGNIGHKTQKDRHVSLSFCVLCPILPVSIFLGLLPNVTRVYLSLSCAQCYPYLSFCVLCPMLPMSIFLCLVPNITLSIFLCLVFNATRVYLSVSLDTRHRKIDTGNIGHKTQKDKHRKHWTQDIER